MKPETFLAILKMLITCFALVPVVLIARQNNNKIAAEFVEVSLINAPATVVHDECALITLLIPNQVNLH